ncbi:MAG TPA: alanine--glyoxylate aminotransferase family protein [Citreicella sp.]|jgi:alanine-glyoxylate transaminase/serine-glyoxylate transaminase/serine-pyruvate transaminase|uniref:Alanine-glyoxylate transaminase / serine-glyoxylate transaminase / serine-pyruvate transaminase n=1 Tax=Salipiger marinus TaxID=555512 RepID=A0A1G8JND0_9RHOB|nr:aminotransferase class V-fold PLP-dependent enzyme [Salipiger marinus]SDI32789.1 alanine-glyoxylate transaminase / serine-glyoxylate transaminase / serine-pyruvate transaminase [Salipiger marinus]HBM57893.1 alanine--glyoxylate aminotransferase family protein [Citreicella sp.]
MSLAHGRPYLAIPGPSVMPDAVLRAMHRASPNIYEGALVEMVADLIPDLQYVAQTTARVAIYICNGHGAWEAALANVAEEGDVVLVPATGRFGHGWAEMARGLGIETQVIDFGTKSTFDPAQVAAALEADKAHRIKAVLATHVDTASSVRNDIAALGAAMRATGHPALLMADCVASLGVDEFRMDDWGVDVMVTGSQKGLMVPPGLGFVYFNDRAAARRTELRRVSRYWDWTPRGKPDFFYEYFGGTAPTHHLYGLRAALDMIREEGLEQVWSRHATLARAIWAAVEVWGQGGPMTLNITDPSLRSHAVTALRLGAPHGTRLREWTAAQTGVTLGIGLGMTEPDDPKGTGFFRLGHMGHVNAHMILGLLGVVESGLRALDIPHGKGALGAAAEVISGA